ncbi:MAG TPA: hypothetical protein ENK23_01075 [Sorangium sp.]|nr:hypothetical protein [Sorangium sp.]
MRRVRLAVSVVVATCLLAACEYGDEGPPNPAPNGAATVFTGSSGGEAGGPPAATVLRTVVRRSPLGAIVGNLLADGDFEYAAQREGRTAQAGWYVFTNSGPQHLRIETGGLCRSGLRCGVLTAGVLLWGRGTAANGTGMVGSVWLKPPPERLCAVADVTLARCAAAGLGVTLPPTSAAPDEHGWCHYRGRVAAAPAAVCMLIQSHLSAGETALVDAATVLPDNGTAPFRVMQPLPAAKAARYRKVSRRLRDLLPIGAGAGAAAGKALTPAPEGPIRTGQTQKN